MTNRKSGESVKVELPVPSFDGALDQNQLRVLKPFKIKLNALTTAGFDKADLFLYRNAEDGSIAAGRVTLVIHQEATVEIPWVKTLKAGDKITAQAEYWYSGRPDIRPASQMSEPYTIIE